MKYRDTMKSAVNILIINDSEPIVAAMKAVLEDAGYLVKTAADGRAGLEILKTDPCDLVVLDISMPVMDGYETIRDIRESYNSEILPVLFVSSTFDDIASKVKALTLGGNDYLTEPIIFEELLLRIAVQLRGKGHYEELLHTRQSLEISELRYRTILDTIQEGYYEADLGGNITFFNNSAARIFGYPPEEFMGMNYRVFTPDRDVERIFRLYNGIFRTREPVDIFDYEIIKSDGTTAVLEISSGLILGADSKASGFFGVARDITDRREKENEMKIKDLAIEMSASAIAITDDNGWLTYVNTVFDKMWGLDKRDGLDKMNIRQCLVLDDADEFMDNIKEMKMWIGEVTAVTIEGKEFYANLSASVISDNHGIVFTFIDITMRKLAEYAVKESAERLRKSNRNMLRDLEIARIAQRELVLKEKPRCPFLNVKYRLIPMEAVGGDYFSFLDFGKRCFGSFMCDITGHGVASSLFLALVKFASEKITRACGTSPGDFLSRLNNELIGFMSSYFLTGLYGVFEKGTDGAVDFSVSNGGHTQPVLLRKNGDVEFITVKNTVIGIIRDLAYEEARYRLEQGDRIFFYTDGIPETANEKRQFIGFEDGLLDIFRNSAGHALSESIEKIIGDVNGFRGGAQINDDMAIIGFEVK